MSGSCFLWSTWQLSPNPTGSIIVVIEETNLLKCLKVRNAYKMTTELRQTTRTQWFTVKQRVVCCCSDIDGNNLHLLFMVWQNVPCKMVWNVCFCQNITHIGNSDSSYGNENFSWRYSDHGYKDKKCLIPHKQMHHKHMVFHSQWLKHSPFV